MPFVLNTYFTMHRAAQVRLELTDQDKYLYGVKKNCPSPQDSSFYSFYSFYGFTILHNIKYHQYQCHHLPRRILQ